MKVFQLSLLWKWQEPLPPPLPPKYTFFLRALSSEGTDGLKIVDFGQVYQKSSVIFSASIFRGECWPLTGNHIPSSLQSWAPKSCSVISKVTGHQHQGCDGSAPWALFCYPSTGEAPSAAVPRPDPPWMHTMPFEFPLHPSLSVGRVKPVTCKWHS